MKDQLLILFVAIAVSSCNPETDETQQSSEEITEKEVIDTTNTEEVYEYDSVYAVKVGADEIGMKSYVMAFLKRGPNRPEDKDLIDSLQLAHLANINKLAEEGKLVLAGPFFGDDDLRGIYIFDTDSIEEAASWTATDPAIIYGSLEMELMKWYGSAALMDVNNLHKKAAKENF